MPIPQRHAMYLKCELPLKDFAVQVCLISQTWFCELYHYGSYVYAEHIFLVVFSFIERQRIYDMLKYVHITLFLIYILNNLAPFVFCITFYTSGFVRADVIQYLFLTMKPLDISLHSRCVRCERVVSVSFMCTNMYENTNKAMQKKFSGSQIIDLKNMDR